MTTKLDTIRAREQAATRAPWETNVQSQYAAEVVAPCPCCGLVAKRVFPWDAEFIAHARADIPLLLAVAEAAAEWLAAIERFRDPYVPIGDTRALATVAENKMRAAIAPLMEEAE